jgi:UDP-N-acetylglucosamine 2-epimerase (non-hydrolysing)
LRNEHLPGDIYHVGNTVLDTVRLTFESERTGAIIDKDCSEDSFVLVTLHRAENVDNPRIRNILMALSDSDLNFVYPMHPRTRKNIQRFGLGKLLSPKIKIEKPVGYLDFLRLLRMCKYVITDSGGIQEEITSPFIDKHALILRDSTERPESIKSGHAMLCPSLDYNVIIDAITNMESLSGKSTGLSSSPYGCGNSAEKIVEILRQRDLLS